jgi:hypothetical protein
LQKKAKTATSPERNEERWIDKERKLLLQNAQRFLPSFCGRIDVQQTDSALTHGVERERDGLWLIHTALFTVEFLWNIFPLFAVDCRVTLEWNKTHCHVETPRCLMQAQYGTKFWTEEERIE